MNCNGSFSDPVQTMHLTSDVKLAATSVGVICKSKIFPKIWFLNVRTVFFVGGGGCGTECGRSGAVIGRGTADDTRYGAQ
jgi:hypothetical protein